MTKSLEDIIKAITFEIENAEEMENETMKKIESAEKNGLLRTTSYLEGKLSGYEILLSTLEVLKAHANAIATVEELYNEK